MTAAEQVGLETSRAKWSRISLFRYSPALVLVVIAIANSMRVADPDMWGHIRYGQAVLRLRQLVLHDPYSYSVPGHLWLSHEWLTEVILAALYNHWGVFGLDLMKLACAAVAIIFVAAALAQTGASTRVQFATLIAAAVLLKPQIQYRPQSFTFALLAVLVFLLARDTYRRRGGLWLAIPIMALWANLHGGFIMGIASLGVYGAVSGAQDFFAGRGAARGMKLAALTAAATLATLATPYGIDTWYTVIHALRNPYTRLVIQDWLPLGPAMLAHWAHGGFVSNYEIAALLMAGTVIFWSLTIEPDDLALAAVAALMSISAVLSVRNLPIAGIAVAAPFARHLEAALRRWRGKAAERKEAPGWAWWLNQGVLAALSVLLFVHSGLFTSRLESANPLPFGACAFMDEHDLKGNILNDFAWGQFLIWQEPQSRVFIDGRYDTLYPFELIRDYIRFNFDQPGGDFVLTKFPTQFVLISPRSLSRKLMDARPDWKLIYRDNVARLYARADSAAARLFAAPVRGHEAIDDRIVMTADAVRPAPQG
jgi:hypothetical protein